MSIVTERIAKVAPSQEKQNLRVMLITQASGGGVGRHVFDLAQGLAQRDVDVVGVYSPRKLDTACRARLAATDLPPMHAFPIRRAIHPADAADLWRLMRLIRKHGPFDIIHGHSSKGGALARLAGLCTGIPSIYTPNAFVTQDLGLPGWQRTFYGGIERWLGRWTAAVIAVSHDEIAHAKNLGIDPRRIHLVPNGISPPSFPSRDAVRSRLNIGADELVIGFVGRLTPQKAPEVMVDSFAAAFRNQPNARLLMIGGGLLEAEVRRRIEQLGLGARIALLGDVVATDFMPAFDIFCMSSRYEGMPYVLIEALSAGLPIVTTDIGGATMCVEPDRNGVIVPTENVPALAAALSSLAADAPRRHRFGAAAREIADRYTLDNMVEQVLGVYQLALQRRPIRV